METKKCPHCKTDIAIDAKKCPQCHTDLRDWLHRHIVLTSIIGLIIVTSIISSVVNSKTSKVANNTEETSTKSYQQIFTFSGHGAKKSESFKITGNKFKIAYDCKGDASATLCIAFAYKVGSQLPEGIMSSTKPIKDETFIYTNSNDPIEYYIDANTTGDFSMTVYDYK